MVSARRLIRFAGATVLASSLIGGVNMPSGWAQPESPPDFISTWGSTGSGPGMFQRMRGFDFDHLGALYIADGENNRIQVFEPSGAYLRSWGVAGIGDGQFQFPMDVAIDLNDEIYVVDGANHRIQKFDAVGHFLLKWGSRGSANGQLESPRGIAIAPDGTVYVAEAGGNRVQRFSASGEYMAKWGTQGSGDGQLSVPSGIAIDAQGNVYVADFGNHRVQVFNASGAFLYKWGTSGNGAGQFSLPNSISISSHQEVYVSDVGNNRIQKFTAAGQYIARWGMAGNGNGEFTEPIEVVVDHSADNVFVADESLNRIQRFSYVYVGLFADSLGLTSDIDVPGGGSAQIHLLGTEGLGSTGAEFRVEVANPSGYFFTYMPPPGAVIIGSPLDLTPQNPNDAAGVSIFFPSCRPSSVQPFERGRTDFGRLIVYRAGGGLTDLIVNPKMPPDNPAMPCARVLGCDSPFFTPRCMTVRVGSDGAFRGRLRPATPPSPGNLQVHLVGINPEVASLSWTAPPGGTPYSYNVYRGIDSGSASLLNASPLAVTSFVDSSIVSGTLCYRVSALDTFGQESALSDSSCVIGASFFADEVLLLDSREFPHDGQAGPVSTMQSLASGRDYLVTVQGTFSSSPATDWISPPNVICGLPERRPITDSPNATNGPVGIDGELVFAGHFPPGGSCNASVPSGYPVHSTAFRMNSGPGYAHREPLGGIPENTSPGHRYQYLVRGEGAPLSFVCFDDATTDNYGMFTISVRRVSETDSPIASSSRDTALHLQVVSPAIMSAMIQYALDSHGFVSLTIFDVQGRRVRRLVDGLQAGGVHVIRWDGRNDARHVVGSGVYFARIETPSGARTQRFVLMK